MNVLNQLIESRFAIYNGDSVEVLKGLPDDSVHYSIFSPPFSSLYVYSNSDRDMGNSSTDSEFWQHFKYLITELYRVIMPGRLVSVHCMDLPLTKSRDGVIGMKDFPGDIIRAFQDAGFVMHSRVTIWKDPLIEATRTKALGLLHKQIVKDSAMCRMGAPDYIVTLRKPGDNPEPHEFATVQDFYTAFYTAQRAFDAYQKERSKWEEAYGEKVTPKFETIHDKIKRYQEKSDNQNANRPYQSKDKGAR